MCLCKEFVGHCLYQSMYLNTPLPPPSYPGPGLGVCGAMRNCAISPLKCVSRDASAIVNNATRRDSTHAGLNVVCTWSGISVERLVPGLKKRRTLRCMNSCLQEVSCLWVFLVSPAYCSTLFIPLSNIGLSIAPVSRRPD